MNSYYCSTCKKHFQADDGRCPDCGGIAHFFSEEVCSICGAAFFLTEFPGICAGFNCITKTWNFFDPLAPKDAEELNNDDFVSDQNFRCGCGHAIDRAGSVAQGRVILVIRRRTEHA